jgi:acyl-CoA synthetase (NDP forming)
VALKIVSPDISHKSDIGGVQLNLTSISQVSRAYRYIIHSARNSLPSARIEGVSVQKMAEPGIELIIGVTRDPQFGLAMMFGIGGILVEILKDVSFRLIPISKIDAEEMISEIKGYALLKGYRGYKPVNPALLQEIMIKVSDFAMSQPQLEELDINPLIASGDSLLAVDARIILRSS